jgi:hypothetical protein
MADVQSHLNLGLSLDENDLPKCTVAIREGRIRFASVTDGFLIFGILISFLGGS